MRVAIDSGPLSSGHAVRGVGVATKALIESLLKYNKNNNVKIEPLDFNTSDLSKFDLLHYTSFNPYFLNYPKIGSLKIKSVLTVHDLIPLIYKKQYASGIKGYIKFLENRYLISKVDRIITVSETSKKDIVRLLKVDEKRISVIYWAPGQKFKRVIDKEKLLKVKNNYRLPNRFVLYVGDVNYNKNLSTLVEACSKVNIKLVVVGKQADNINQLIENYKGLEGPKDMLRFLLGKSHPELSHFNKLSSLLSSSNVFLTGYVKDEDLAAIYTLASVYCQPSYYEGFGIPVLEAFACETPVVIAKTQALVEVADNAALTADPYSQKDMADKVNTLLNDTTKRLHFIREGAKRVKDFSWEITANKTIEVYEKLLKY